MKMRSGPSNREIAILRSDRRFAELVGRIGLPALSTLNSRLLTTSSQLLAPS